MTVLKTPSASQQRAMRARIVSRAAEGATTRRSLPRSGCLCPPLGCGVGTPASVAWTGDRPHRSPAVRGRAMTQRFSALLAMTLGNTAGRHTRTGALAGSRRRRGSQRQTVHRIWPEHKLKPHQVRSFKFSRGPAVDREGHRRRSGSTSPLPKARSCRRGAALARASPRGALRFHIDQRIVDELDRDLVFDPHQTTGPPRRLPRRPRADHSDCTSSMATTNASNRSSGSTLPERVLSNAVKRQDASDALR